MSAILHFGKHQGKTLIETVFTDPAWFGWATDRGVFHDRGGPPLQREAEEVWHKARNIRAQHGNAGGSQVAYYYQGWSHKFLDLRIVADGRFEEHADLKGVLDLGHVYEAGCRDGVGNKLLVKAIKRIVFGEKVRVTADQLEQFFANPDNFDFHDSIRQAAE